MSLYYAPRGPPRRDAFPVALAVGGPADGLAVWLDTSPDARGEKGIMAGVSREGRTLFIPHPETRPGLRDSFLVCGASGAGKSTYASLFAQAWLEHHYGPRLPKFGSEERPFPIVLVCPDRAFAGLPILHLSPAAMAAAADKNEPITIESLDYEKGPMLLLVDDVESLSDKKQLSAMKVLVDAVLTRGRKKNISCVYISHRPADNTKTKTVLQEMTGFAWPITSTNRNITYALETYGKISPEFRASLKEQASALGRWAMVKQDQDPRILVTDHSVAVIDDDAIRRALQRKKAAERLADKRAAKQGAELDE